MSVLPNPFHFEAVTPVSDSAAVSIRPPARDTAASQFPRGFDPRRFLEAIEDGSILSRHPEVTSILARF